MYRDHIKAITDTDAREVLKKDIEYGSSWLKRGGVGAYMMAARKIDRLEEQVKKHHHDVLAAIAAYNSESNPLMEGLIDTIRDLRRYLILIEAEAISQAFPDGSRPLGCHEDTVEEHLIQHGTTITGAVEDTDQGQDSLVQLCLLPHHYPAGAATYDYCLKERGHKENVHQGKSVKWITPTEQSEWDRLNGASTERHNPAPRS